MSVIACLQQLTRRRVTSSGSPLRATGVLAPAISIRTARFEVYGKSIPSTEMGGDLIDL
jgi:hypothetical protein